MLSNVISTSADKLCPGRYAVYGSIIREEVIVFVQIKSGGTDRSYERHC